MISLLRVEYLYLHQVNTPNLKKKNKENMSSSHHLHTIPPITPHLTVKIPVTSMAGVCRNPFLISRYMQ